MLSISDGTRLLLSISDGTRLLLSISDAKGPFRAS